MKTINFLIFCFLAILIIPIFSLISLSFQGTDNNILKWYIEILKNEDFLKAFFYSLAASISVGILSIMISFILSISYFDNKNRLIVLLFILVLGLMPPDIMAISISKLAQILGFNKSNIFFLYFSLIQYCLPFGIIILWVRYYFIDKKLFVISKDLGLNNLSTIVKVLIPISKSGLISVFLFSFLLTFNEYPRTFYLSGATEYLSEYLNGKLNSGMDNSIYAGSTISILITCIIIILYIIIYKYSTAKSKTLKVN